VTRQPQLSSIDVIASTLEPVLPAVGQMSSPDGAVTLMLSDIADAASAAERLGAEGWERLLADHRTLVSQLVGHHDGQVVKFQGDGFLASFNSAHAGLHAALELQRTFADTAGRGAGSGAPLAVRAGLHSGFVIANPDQPLGRNVVLTARIAAEAKAGEILVSDALKRYTESDPGLRFEPRGERHFKGVHGEHLIYAVAWQ
jgi:class 3 adenylate cyclase